MTKKKRPKYVAPLHPTWQVIVRGRTVFVKDGAQVLCLPSINGHWRPNLTGFRRVRLPLGKRNAGRLTQEVR